MKKSIIGLLEVLAIYMASIILINAFFMLLRILVFFTLSIEWADSLGLAIFGFCVSIVGGFIVLHIRYDE
jgi:hypothetical protein